MELFTAIEERKTIRNYNEQQIDKSTLTKIIEAGCKAPIASAKYEKVHITVVQNKKILEKMQSGVSKYFGKDLKAFYGASTLVIVSGKKYPPIGFGEKKWPQEHIEIANTACIIENMILAATALGIGSTYITGFLSCFVEIPELSKELLIPRGFSPLGGLLLGYYNKPSKRMKKTKEIIINYI